ncbi:ROK family protein [Planctomycetota bacterium]|nr:ROK family protein [Planctomycetota bacterium]
MSEVEAIGIDIGGTVIKGVSVNAEGEVIEQVRAESIENIEVLVHRVGRLIEKLGNGCERVGIASPGLADRRNTCIRWMRGRLAGIEGLDWGNVLRGEVKVLNDAHAATLAESWVGAAARYEHVVMLTLGTGVGGGVVSDGKLMQGVNGRAGHLGHICMDVDGEKDIVGTRGSLEDLVGNHTVKMRTGYESTEALVKAAEGGEIEAKKYWGWSLEVLACGVVSFINLFDPEVVVIGGGIAKAGEGMLFEPLRERVQEMEWYVNESGVPIVAAKLGDLAGAVGAARFAMMNEKSSVMRY